MPSDRVARAFRFGASQAKLELMTLADMCARKATRQAAGLPHRVL
jgi:hypothetical protein